MFRIITEGGQEPLPPDQAAVADVPFVEVGGPEGVVTSIPLPAAPPDVIPVPRPAPLYEPEPDTELDHDPESEPLTLAAPEGRVLSVSFHRFPTTGLRLLPGGVSADVIAYHQPDHPISDEYRVIRDEVRKQFNEPNPRVLLFAAAAPVTGTTTVLLNLAVALTRESGARVLVADANFDRPAVARRLGVPEAPGLAEVLGQAVPLAWALQPTAVENLHVLAAGVPADGTPRSMASDYPRLLAQLRKWFDWVLVDGGVWDEWLGQESAGPACDAVYLVTRQADIDRPEFAGLRASVSSAGGVLRGYVTTRQ
jgi:Mrp family chromosome partitioning ATPase